MGEAKITSNLYPLFESGRVVKKELLRSLRDYSFGCAGLNYQLYEDGLVAGCRVWVEGDQLVMEPGIIKYQGFLYLITERQKISYKSAEVKQFLKLRMQKKDLSPDYIIYHAELTLNTMEAQENELEICRFLLQAGAKLRDTYKNFEDMGTCYDTVNLIDASWGGFDGQALSPAIITEFAEAILSLPDIQSEDRNIAYLCLSQQGVISRKALDHYIRYRIGEKQTKETHSRREIFEQMCQVIRCLQSGVREPGRRQKERHRILVD